MAVEKVMMKFNREKVVGTAKVEIPLTAKDINTIICNGLEGGIGYWATFHNDDEEFKKDRPESSFMSDLATQMLLDGKTIRFSDSEKETDEIWELTLEKLVNGFSLNALHRPHDSNLEYGDATTADCIIQYALFGKVVYG